jgi:hypothetical protein
VYITLVKTIIAHLKHGTYIIFQVTIARWCFKCVDKKNAEYIVYYWIAARRYRRKNNSRRLGSKIQDWWLTLSWVWLICVEWCNVYVVRASSIWICRLLCFFCFIESCTSGGVGIKRRCERNGSPPCYLYTDAFVTTRNFLPLTFSYEMLVKKRDRHLLHVWNLVV